MTSADFTDRRYASHLPLLQAAIQLLHPRSAIEYGIGRYSTPHLAALPEYAGLESDSGWIAQLRLTVPLHAQFYRAPRLRPPQDISLYRIQTDLLHVQLLRQCSLDVPWGLAMVDCDPWQRASAIAAIAQYAAAILVHDTQPMSTRRYDYVAGTRRLTDWQRVTWRPTGLPWSDLYLRQSADGRLLTAAVDRAATDLEVDGRLVVREHAQTDTTLIHGAA